MTGDPEQNAGNRERPTRNSPSTYNSAPADESPDLLRWRADSLLDEMMLGGVDVSAADGGGPARPASPRADLTPPGQMSAPGDAYSTGRAYPNGYHEAEPDLAADSLPFEPEADEPSSTLSSQYPAANSYRSVLDSAPALDDDAGSRSYGDPAQGGGEAAPRSDRLYSVEQQYESFRRTQSSQIQPVPIPAPKPAPASVPPASVPPASASAAPPPRERPDATTQWAATPEKWEWQDFGAAPGEPQDPSRYIDPLEPSISSDSAVRQDQAQFVSAMSVMGGKRRSTLLPRMSTLDESALNQEIGVLHGELGSLLPVGHESSERARHLLDKAYSILQSDPMRSAEVEYYMQQVRTIVQRLHQARRWSDLYRDRLRMYLLGWILLASLFVVARFVFPAQLEAFGVVLFGGSAVARHWPSLMGTMAAGALGGAVGAFYTMSRHMRSEFGFFDRKYGLRGLILPLIPAVVGGVIYLPVGLLYSLVGIDPSLNLTADIVPMMLAFAFGFSQEWFYGTRG